MLTIEQVKENGWLIFEAVTGSRAYGLATENSDTDIRGVFVLPKEYYYSLEYTPQVSNATNDIVYYELRRFLELLERNNPNILELLNIPETFILQRHELMDQLLPRLFLSRLCEKSFANYAFTQIKKAFGLEKKIMNPVDKERKPVPDFCYVYAGKEVISLADFLQRNKFRQDDLGLSALPHLQDCYHVYHSTEGVYNGLVRKDMANDLSLSSIPKGEEPVGLLYFNKDGYSVYCRQYKEYWDWVSRRNEERYKSTMLHGKNYDAKNMMHVFRLLHMAREIAVEKQINVHRKDRAFLLDIREGKYEYEQLVTMAEKLKEDLASLFETSGLQEMPDKEQVNKLLFTMRDTLYAASGKKE
jgi:uncharacterized protein